MPDTTSGIMDILINKTKMCIYLHKACIPMGENSNYIYKQTYIQKHTYG